MPWRETGPELARAWAERPVVVPGPHGGLYGIFTPPAPEAPSAGLCAVLFTRPRLHRNRMWVEAARRLAARGFACFRFDYHGAGDSEGDSVYLDPNRPYREDAIAVLRYLRERLGQRRFVLSGLCFDARTALSAFVDEGEAIEGLVFIGAPVLEMETMVKVDADHRSWRQMARAFRKPDNWRALASLERWKYMAIVLGRMLGRSLPQARRDYAIPSTFVEHMRALIHSRARALFLYGADEPEYESFRAAERKILAALPPETRRRFEVEVWPGVVHRGTLHVARQREILERATSWILALHPTAPSSSAGTAGG